MASRHSEGGPTQLFQRPSGASRLPFPKSPSRKACPCLWGPQAKFSRGSGRAQRWAWGMGVVREITSKGAGGWQTSAN